MVRKTTFSKPTLLLCALGLLLNVALVWMTKLFGIPLYLDSIGTVLVASLGGALPGIAVGFFSNCITAFISVSPDPMTLYYGFLSVLIAAAAAWMSKRGLFLKWYGRVIGLFVFSAIGGALGSLVTWILYGFSFGQGISAPLASFLFGHLGLSKFFAQLAADIGIDLADKLLTLVILCAALYLLPISLLEKLPLGYVYKNRGRLSAPGKLRAMALYPLHKRLQFRKRSINTKITALILISTTALSVIAVTIGTVTYREKLIAQYSEMCSYAVDMMLSELDGDRVEDFLAQGEDTAGYVTAQQELCDIFHSAQDIKYMYVYSIRPDGCHVIFDLDTAELAGEPAGTLIEFDASFPYVDELLAGREIPPVITNDTYGWLLTVYKPVRDTQGAVVAYAAADIAMDNIRTNVYTFLINIASLLFGAMILIAMVSIWYCDRKLLEPMNVLATQARDFDFEGTHTGGRVRDRCTVKTGDELEEIFDAMCLTEDTIAGHIREIKDKNVEISRMQRNIIYTLANMVENRDGNTGGHIRRTANYVRLIGEKLRADGACGGRIDEEYIKNLYDSAPLHDIGKIKVPDAILNKPGKLTEAEFERMKTHAEEGAKILRASLAEIEDGSWLAMAIDMAMYHHEKWDGSGYPRGLSGEQIPLCARIMAVSDVFDALVSERSYKKPYPFAEAMEIIRAGAGSHFDPMIVAAFTACESEVLKIMNS